MALEDHTHKRSSGLLRLLVPVLGSDLIEILVFFVRLAKQTLKFKAHEGMYEVLDYHAQLELLDPEGKQAVLHKRQTVRFRQDNIIAYQDRAWGDGDFMAAYQCSPGVAVDQYQEGYRTNILISLRETKHAGDVEEFRIDRTIRDGFIRPSEDFQIDIDHRTQRFVISVVFPLQRPPKEVALIEQNSTRRTVLGPEHRTELADGRYEYAWMTDKPRLFEAYILRWDMVRKCRWLASSQTTHRTDDDDQVPVPPLMSASFLLKRTEEVWRPPQARGLLGTEEKQKQPEAALIVCLDIQLIKCLHHPSWAYLVLLFA